jgi:exodeoxyribonuclease VII large subunit
LSVNLQAKGPAYFLSREKLRFQAANDKLARNFKMYVTERRHRLEILSSRLEMSNPERLLDLGYAVVTKSDGHVVTAVGQVTLDEELKINMKDGVINAFVTGKKIGIP